MPKQAGRSVLVRVDLTGAGLFTTIGGAQTKSLTINNEQVDVTNSDSNQWRELLAGAGVRSISISLKGVFDDDAAANKVLEYSMNGTIREFQFFVPSMGTFEGMFQTVSFELSGEYKGEVQYSCSFESAGPITLTVS
ncbi:MAG: phage major tail protein, TP901-1 family [Ahrensia sp.]|nr:phage major tail protein, TP901-1 family [Ahrensia sp.]